MPMMNEADPQPAESDVLRPTAVRDLLLRLGIRPSRSLGQNFLIDRNIARLIVDAAGIGPDDAVLEVGPGLGALTQALAARARRVLAIEKDHRLAAHLQRSLAGLSNVEVRQADMLSLSVDSMTWTGEGRLPINAMVSNLPYACGSRILVDVAQSRQPPSRVVVTVQREVAERMTAGPGDDAYGLLSVWLQRVYSIRIIHAIGPRCFFPEPEVDSSVVRLEARPDRTPWTRRFIVLTRHAFSQRRKQLARMLSSPTVPPEVVRGLLREQGVPDGARPEHVGVDAWVRLVSAIERLEQAGAGPVADPDTAGGADA